MNLLSLFPDNVLVEVLLNLSPYDINSLYSIESVSKRLVNFISLTKDTKDLTVFNNVPRESQVLLPKDSKKFAIRRGYIQLFEFEDAKSYTEIISKLNDSTPKFIVFPGTDHGPAIDKLVDVNECFGKNPKSSFHYFMFEPKFIRQWDVIFYPEYFHFPNLIDLELRGSEVIADVSRKKQKLFNYNNAESLFIINSVNKVSEELFGAVDFERNDPLKKLVLLDYSQNDLILFRKTFDNITHMDLQVDDYGNVHPCHSYKYFTIAECNFFNLKSLYIRCASGGIINNSNFPNLEVLSIHQKTSTIEGNTLEKVRLENLMLPELIQFEWVSSFSAPIIGPNFEASKLRLLRLYISTGFQNISHHRNFEASKIQDARDFKTVSSGLASIIPEYLVVDYPLVLEALNSHGALKNVKYMLLSGEHLNPKEINSLRGLKFDNLIKVGLYDIIFDSTEDTLPIFQSPSLKQFMIKTPESKRLLNEMRSFKSLKNSKELVLDGSCANVVGVYGSEVPRELEKILIKAHSEQEVFITGSFENLKSLIIENDYAYKSEVSIKISAPNLVLLKAHGVNLKNLELFDCPKLKIISADKAERIKTHEDLISLKHFSVLNTTDTNEIDIKASNLTYIKTPLNAKFNLAQMTDMNGSDQKRQKLEVSNTQKKISELVDQDLEIFPLLDMISKEFKLDPDNVIDSSYGYDI
ncbi:hypothetical protein BN7_2926 [Wickerhamomyces ciferrii]|uniref:F-box domain-containing protein n=1 Tax=Wickerhamomyces ciferrii (strain ATCC 14091 / BCRC 22168 / CBS 111 / JCM 3599 / NBRC 0793 / NRRL Y-1031 F-60-10) TaxID=1206466 RepID=K0KQ84_WICCF|nr:uncharacterized protein BN7_2926 [Wickerhamomyces ciferrii]CCH43378.1 hypothetical protein BN7_2926 [Wickerhamomyces ciferrii]